MDPLRCVLYHLEQTNEWTELNRTIHANKVQPLIIIYYYLRETIFCPETSKIFAPVLTSWKEFVEIYYGIQYNDGSMIEIANFMWWSIARELHYDHAQ